ncbi:MAG: hypothetical protein HOO99_04070 [Hyphomicrobiaceae bacterium]|nr:hypothetical protein [Hyphomicrobiaceae bacterium]
MAGKKPTLGYPSRTEAVRALLAANVEKSEIARRIGIAVKDISALEASAARTTSTRHGVGTNKTVLFSHADLVRGRKYAAARGINVNELFRQIIEAVLDDELVDAVLDDGAGLTAVSNNQQYGAS